ncbi:hypothetical protein [Chitinophaga sp. LS1]|uniref:hypothetical protein n=1 Tax=Chitinophaga sp. LS1 TaxID=3051176 RepID=UPI002AAA9396|nr:hypothetical protein [Chitinophaga sp. LS1]WPV67105.1 hypothetical protein QQL36_35535 [Chitinophaga sp. LS1]WPV70346.1 hypothetical protein QQL36_16685 [Chitinophaga sp. LS1]WPV70564.1 hypothetical protein QQL36_17790 [Chitinophaga sp. LS1]
MDKISTQEQTDVKQIAAIKAEIESRMNDFDYANNITDELFRYQPFILSTIMGYKMDVPMEDLPDLINLYVLIWLFYRDKKNVRKVQITEQQYSKQESRFVEMLKKYETNISTAAKNKMIDDDLNSFYSKSLYAMLVSECRENKILHRLNRESGGAVYAGYITLIKCFDEIIAK